jgi:uncharacterized membrane protein
MSARVPHSFHPTFDPSGRHDRPDGARSDTGQAVLVTVLGVGLVLVFLLVLARTGAVLDDRARAVTAADAAALAGAVEGEPGAAELAAANGAVLERFERHGAEVVVDVRIGRVRARARAEARPIFEATGTIP